MTVILVADSCNSAMTFIEGASLVSQTMINLFQRFLGLGQAVFFCAFGAKEILFDTSLFPPEKLSKKVTNACTWLYDRVGTLIETVSSYSFVHGALYLGSGVATGLAAIHQLDWVNLGLGYPIASAFSNGLFLMSNFSSLCYHCRLLCQVSKEDNNDLSGVRFSAAFAIISNISYIIGTVLGLIGAPVALIVLIFCLGLLAGCVKILFDLFTDSLQKPILQSISI